jgi:two-component system sensor histidine kinase/response regulator
MRFKLDPTDFLILIVDDTQANIKLLSHVLRGAGFNPIVAFNGTDAIDLIKSRKPDMVLLDIMMPDMTGYEVCTVINEIEGFSDMPIIFLSALSETSDKVEGFKVGGVDYITKPFQKDEVLARIRTHLFLSKLQKEREQRIEILKNRELELSALNRKKDNLMRMVSHDIKNPLTGIVGLANLIKTNPDFPEDEKRNMLEVMEQSGQKLLDMVEKVLDNESSAENESEPIYTDTDLEELAEKVISVNNPKAILKEIDLNFKLDLIKETAKLDFVKIEIALNNLISNALKFTLRNGEVILHVRSSNDQIEFKVQDTGIGMAPNLIDKLFSDNKNGESVTNLGTDGEIGTGLGLDVVQNYVSLHGGDISVTSKEGEGTTFHITIPATI